MLCFRLADTLRELGRFPEAQLALNAIPTVALIVEDAQLQSADYEITQQAESRQHLAQQITLLRDHIARSDASPEPLRMIPEDIALAYCVDMLDSGRNQIDEFRQDGTREQKLQAIRDQMREWRESTN